MTSMDEIICYNCGHQFCRDRSLFRTIERGDLVIQYFTCPACGKRYHVFTSDTKMRNLIQRQMQVQTRIKAAFVGKFREKTIRGCERELDKIKREQDAIMPALRVAGEKILYGEDHDAG